MKTAGSGPARREPVRAIGTKAARVVREELGYEHPMELDIDALAYLRGATVRSTPARGARANAIRVHGRSIISVTDGLTDGERRWAVAHELGHLEAHPDVSFLELCASGDMLPSYDASGREPEANAFAAELLMPEDLFARRCDVAKVSWAPMRALAEEYGVSPTAAALRFLTFTEERAALVSCKDGRVQWSWASRSFGRRPRKGSRVGEWTEAHAFFCKGAVSDAPETVSASAWLDGAEDDEDLVEHVLGMPAIGVALSLLWRPT